MKKTKSDRRKLKDKCEKLSKDIVRDRDNRICQKCRKGPLEGANCHVSHVIPVSAGSWTEFDTINMKILCFHHHINWWHKNPIESAEWFETTFPDRYQYLQEAKKKNGTPMKLFHLEEIYEALKKEKEYLTNT